MNTWNAGTTGYDENAFGPYAFLASRNGWDASTDHQRSTDNEELGNRRGGHTMVFNNSAAVHSIPLGRRSKPSTTRRDGVEVLTRLPEKDRDIAFFLMETGLRPGEVCALLVQHFDEAEGKMRIERTFTGSRIRETTKQKKKRIIPLSDVALNIAKKHAQGKHPQAFLFVNSGTGRHYLPDTLWQIWHVHSGLDIRLTVPVTHSAASLRRRVMSIRYPS